MDNREAVSTLVGLYAFLCLCVPLRLVARHSASVATARCAFRALASHRRPGDGGDITYTRFHRSGAPCAADAPPARPRSVVAAAMGGLPSVSDTAAGPSGAPASRAAAGTEAARSEAAASLGSSGSAATAAPPPRPAHGGEMTWQGALLHTSLVMGASGFGAVEVPAWHNLRPCRGAVFSIATGSAAGAGTLVLEPVDPAGGGGPQQPPRRLIHLRHYWVRRFTRVGAQPEVIIAVAAAAATCVVAGHIAIMAVGFNLPLAAGVPWVSVAVMAGAAFVDGGPTAAPRPCFQLMALPPWGSLLGYGVAMVAAGAGFISLQPRSYDVIGSISVWAPAVIIWGAVTFIATALAVANVPSGGTAIALIPRPHTPAAAAAAAAATAAVEIPTCARLWGACCCGHREPERYELMDDGTAMLPEDRHALAAPPGTHVLVAGSAEEAAQWERVLAYESCNGVLGVSLPVLKRLSRAATMRAAALREHKERTPGFELPMGADAVLVSTAFVNYQVTVPLCVEAAKSVAQALSGASPAALAAEPSLSRQFQQSLYSTFMRPVTPGDPIAAAVASSVQAGAYAAAAAAASAAWTLPPEPAPAPLLNPLTVFPPEDAVDSASSWADEAGPATGFVSHVWSQPFELLVGALASEEANYQARSAKVRMLSFDGIFFPNSPATDPALLEERPRRYWIDIVFKNQANASSNPLGDEAGRLRNAELQRVFDERYRLQRRPPDFRTAGDLSPREVETLEVYSAATQAEFEHCIGGPGVVLSICNELSRSASPVPEPPAAWGRLWCLLELWTTAARGGRPSALPPPGAASPLPMERASGSTGVRVYDYDDNNRPLQVAGAPSHAVSSWPGAALFVLRERRPRPPPMWFPRYARNQEAAAAAAARRAHRQQVAAAKARSGGDAQVAGAAAVQDDDGDSVDSLDLLDDPLGEAEPNYEAIADRMLAPLSLDIDLRRAQAASALDLFMIFDHVASSGGFASVTSKLRSAVAGTQLRFLDGAAVRMQWQTRRMCHSRMLLALILAAVVALAAIPSTQTRLIAAGVVVLTGLVTCCSCRLMPTASLNALAAARNTAAALLQETRRLDALAAATAAYDSGADSPLSLPPPQLQPPPPPPRNAQAAPARQSVSGPAPNRWPRRSASGGARGSITSAATGQRLPSPDTRVDVNVSVNVNPLRLASFRASTTAATAEWR